MYIGDGRKTLKFAVRISAFYLLYAMNKLRLSAYLCTPSGNPKLCLGSVCPFCTIFPKPGGRSHGSLSNANAKSGAAIFAAPLFMHFFYNAAKISSAIFFIPKTVG